MKFDRFGKVTAERISEMEGKYNISLPAEYREFLLNNNGGVAPRDSRATIFLQPVSEEIDVEIMFGLGIEDCFDIDYWMCQYQDELPPRSLLIGSDTIKGFFVLNQTDGGYRVYYWDDERNFKASTDESNAYLIVNDFSEFLRMINGLEESGMKSAGSKAIGGPVGHTMSNTIEYKGYVGSVEFSKADGIFFGEVLGIPDLISYEGATKKELADDFRGAIDDYLTFCEETGTKPKPSFSREEYQEGETMEKFGFVYATKMLVEGKRKVHYMYHEETTNPQDSGWRFFCGEENDDYANNPDNIAIYDINTILDIDKSVLPYLNYPAGIALEREDTDAAFAVSRDFAAGKRSADKN